MKSPLIFRVFKNNQIHFVKQFVDRDQIVFGHTEGSTSDVDIDLDSKEVSAIHCLVEKRGPQFYLCDLGSAQGTFKNGHAVLDEPLQAGDEFNIGPFKIVFFVGAPKPTHAEHSAAGGSAPITTPTPPPPPTADPKTAAVVPPLFEAQPQPASAAQPQPVSAAQPQPASVAQPQQIVEAPVAPVPAQVQPPPPPITPVVIPQAPVESPVARPRIATSFVSQKKESVLSKSSASKNQKTYAPRSSAQKLNEVVRPGQGGMVEVIVSWKERVLNTYHFNPSGQYKAGPAQAIQLPEGVLPKGWVLVDCSAGVTVRLTPEMKCEVHNAEAVREVKDSMYRLHQNEVLFIELSNGMQLAVRFAPKTALAPLDSPLIFTSSEFTGLLAALIIATLTSLIVSVMTPKQKPVEEEIQREAMVVFNKPPVEVKPPPPPPPPPVKAETPPPPPPKPPEPPKKITEMDKKQEQKNKGDVNKPDAKAQAAQHAGRAAEVRPKDSNNKKKMFTSAIKQGGAVKTGSTNGANAQSKEKDPTEMGLASAFGSGGAQDKLNKAYSGSGELIGTADKATGTSGFNEDRAGSGLGGKVKDTGAGGKGTATVGIAGVGTKGRGTGMSAYGSGDGFGSKDQVAVSPGGAEEEFIGKIDREAVRRAILNSISMIKSCYDREYRKDTTLQGKVVVKFEIHERGVAKNSTVDNGATTLKNSTVSECVRRRILEIRFPEPPAGTFAEISYPFSFRGQQ